MSTSPRTRSATTTRTSRSILSDIWPTTQEIADTVRTVVTAEMFATRYSDVFKGDEQWQRHQGRGRRHLWLAMASTYVQNPPYFEGMTMTPEPVTDVDERAVLALFGDSITTDHISPAGDIKEGPGRRVPARTPGAGDRLQLLRRAPRQP